MNATNTHLSIRDGKIKWTFTGSYGACTSGCSLDE